jgi:hypothetical protein
MYLGPKWMLFLPASFRSDLKNPSAVNKIRM